MSKLQTLKETSNSIPSSNSNWVHLNDVSQFENGVNNLEAFLKQTQYWLDQSKILTKKHKNNWVFS